MDTDAVLRLLQDVAEQVINPRFRDLADHEVDEKNPGDLVTAADREAEVLLTKALVAAYPDAVVLGEETFAGDPSLMTRYAEAQHAFTVDPVDGTKNFVEGKRDHAVMVGEVRGGEAVRGWIWQPQHGLAYVAEKGAGAFRNGERLDRPAPPEDPARWRGTTSRRRWLGRTLDGLDGLPPLELTWVCCGVDYPKLLEGEADFVLYGRANPWDHVPGSLLLAEAGAFVGTHDGTPYEPRLVTEGGLVAAADRTTYDAVVAALAAS
ncbi:inositol monophosphatase family protein [Nocardioides sp. GCM10027113]|uniref:inositol monophosphatase family protein n=1 Tax=unclassified Nocardioides TaxID=2615069 RepID=UPI00361026F8